MTVAEALMMMIAFGTFVVHLLRLIFDMRASKKK
jgi:hypothetical protein